jgi:hypothetical protein
MILEILLVIILSRVKLRSGFNRSHDRIRIDLRGCQLTDHFLRRRPLLGRMIENHRPVLRSTVVPLPIERGWIVRGKEDFQDIAEANKVGIVHNLDHFNMAGCTGTYILIGRMGTAASHISRDHRDHTRCLPVNRFNAPETSPAESRRFLSHYVFMIVPVEQKSAKAHVFERAFAGFLPPDREMLTKFDYFAAGAAAGAWVAAGVAAVLLLDFLFFFTCFFATGAELPVAGAAVCAASDNPAVASVRERPSNTDVIFFMMFYPVLFRSAFFCFYLY